MAGGFGEILRILRYGCGNGSWHRNVPDHIDVGRRDMKSLGKN
jgi:hypothetical protein